MHPWVPTVPCCPWPPNRQALPPHCHPDGPAWAHLRALPSTLPSRAPCVTSSPPDAYVSIVFIISPHHWNGGKCITCLAPHRIPPGTQYMLDKWSIGVFKILLGLPSPCGPHPGPLSSMIQSRIQANCLVARPAGEITANDTFKSQVSGAGAPWGLLAFRELDHLELGWVWASTAPPQPWFWGSGRAGLGCPGGMWTPAGGHGVQGC